MPEAWDTKAGMTQSLAFQAQREGQKPFFLQLFTLSTHIHGARLCLGPRGGQGSQQ